MRKQTHGQANKKVFLLIIEWIVWILSLSIEAQAIFFLTFWSLVIINNLGLHIPYLDYIIIWIGKFINVCIAYINEHMHWGIPMVSTRGTSYIAIVWIAKASITFAISRYIANVAKKRLQKLEATQT